MPTKARAEREQLPRWRSLEGEQVKVILDNTGIELGAVAQQELCVRLRVGPSVYEVVDPGPRTRAPGKHDGGDALAACRTASAALRKAAAPLIREFTALKAKGRSRCGAGHRKEAASILDELLAIEERLARVQPKLAAMETRVRDNARRLRPDKDVRRRIRDSMRRQLAVHIAIAFRHVLPDLLLDLADNKNWCQLLAACMSEIQGKNLTPAGASDLWRSALKDKSPGMSMLLRMIPPKKCPSEKGRK